MIEAKKTLVVVGLLLVAGLTILGSYNFLLFHSIAEIFSVVIAFSIFLFAWNTRRFADSGYLLFLGIAYLFVGSIDFLHALAYKGMNIFYTEGANLSVQLWITARYIEAFSLLIAVAFLKRTFDKRKVFFVYLGVFLFALLTIFQWNVFPTCYIEGQGLTPFKVGSEYLIATILLVAIVLYFKYRSLFPKGLLSLLVASIGFTILAEMMFTLYVDIYDLFISLGYFFKILSYFLIYLAIIEIGLISPTKFVFRLLKESEQRYAQAEEAAGIGS